MSDAWGAHAGLGQAVIEPRGGAIAEVGAHRLVDRVQHLQQHKNRAGKGQRPGQSMSLLYGADQHAHGNGKR